jgi:hypothetical protein
VQIDRSQAPKPGFAGPPTSQSWSVELAFENLTFAVTATGQVWMPTCPNARSWYGRRVGLEITWYFKYIGVRSFS